MDKKFVLKSLVYKQYTGITITMNNKILNATFIRTIIGYIWNIKVFKIYLFTRIVKPFITRITLNHIP